MVLGVEAALIRTSISEWSTVRKQLETSHYFGDALNNIPKEKWENNRRESLAKLMKLCQSNGYKSLLIDAFIKSLGEGHHLTQALREHLGLQHKGYEAMVNIQQFERQKGIAQQSFCLSNTFCGIACALSLAVAILTIAMVMCAMLAPFAKYSPTLGVNGDTVLLGNPTTPRNSHLSISECVQSGDYYHTSDIFVVPSSEVVVHERLDQWSSRVFDQTSPSLNTGIVDYLYLVDGSRISYKLCVVNEASSVQRGTFYIFNRREDYFSYINQLNNPGQNAVFLQNFTLAPNNLTTCIPIDFTVQQSAYYFLTASTPSNIHYNYTYNITTRYYNSSDYSLRCSVLDTTTCDVSLPFGFKKYTVLAYIHPLADSDPFATHICLDTSWSKSAKIQMPVIGATVVSVFLLLFVMTLIYLMQCCCSYGHRNGYARIGAE